MFAYLPKGGATSQLLFCNRICGVMIATTTTSTKKSKSKLVTVVYLTQPFSTSSSHQSRTVVGTRYNNNNKKEPLFKIPIHVLVFGVILTPVLVYAWYADRYKVKDDVLEEEIRRRYGHDIQPIQQQNRAMQDIFRNAIMNPESGIEDERLRTMLYGGMGRNQKRLHEVDKELLGTKEGQRLAQQTQEKMQQEAILRKQRRKERKQKKAMESTEIVEETKHKESNGIAAIQKQFQTIVDSVDTKQAITVVVVGSAAALAGYLLGGGRRNT